MSEAAFSNNLLARLPAVRGRYSENAKLANVTWFRVGGPAEVLFKPADRDDLIHFLQEKPADVPVTLLGVGSNLLVRDGGLPGVVIRLGRLFASIEAEGDRLVCGAGALDVNIAEMAKRESLSGLEFLCGIPGTLGGALRMNAGAYQRELKDVLIGAEALTAEGEVKALDPESMGLSYRHSSVPEDWIFTGAVLQGRAGNAADIERRMEEIRTARGDSQPVRSRTGGSTFKNPPGEKAWQLIERAGCRGLTVGGAQVSEQHCNFLINTGAATAADLENLGEEVRRRVQDATGITLEWEIRRIGLPAGGDS
ncbi:UDP-N-acetylmuramate dehydrogenase [Fodinicurvata fenggangensis]|uniref:UDP-N-acetylmuramate dehydrogenase n=1 Tax=Fodinicurvata fenggangensis TaxID=1121830 RepID=UPI0004793362|nr:UDP-N-acetylmuramate dehydrogenase [Fodinicurvata fenggangensis]